jgi:hypothetical protein
MFIRTFTAVALVAWMLLYSPARAEQLHTIYLTPADMQVTKMSSGGAVLFMDSTFQVPPLSNQFSLIAVDLYVTMNVGAGGWDYSEHSLPYHYGGNVTVATLWPNVIWDYYDTGPQPQVPGSSSTVVFFKDHYMASIGSFGTDPAAVVLREIVDGYGVGAFAASQVPIVKAVYRFEATGEYSPADLPVGVALSVAPYIVNYDPLLSGPIPPELEFFLGVPEPSSLALLMTSLAVLLRWRPRRC